MGADYSLKIRIYR